MLRRALPDSCARIAAEVDTGRRAGGSDRDAFEHDVRELVAEQWRLEWAELLTSDTSVVLWAARSSTG